MSVTACAHSVPAVQRTERRQNEKADNIRHISVIIVSNKRMCRNGNILRRTRKSRQKRKSDGFFPYDGWNESKESNDNDRRDVYKIRSERDSRNELHSRSCHKIRKRKNRNTQHKREIARKNRRRNNRKLLSQNPENNSLRINQGITAGTA